VDRTARRWVTLSVSCRTHRPTPGALQHGLSVQLVYTTRAITVRGAAQNVYRCGYVRYEYSNLVSAPPFPPITPERARSSVNRPYALQLTRYPEPKSSSKISTVRFPCSQKSVPHVLTTVKRMHAYFGPFCSRMAAQGSVTAVPRQPPGSRLGVVGRCGPRTRCVSQARGRARMVLLALRRVGEERYGLAGTEQGQQRQDYCKEGDEGPGGGARCRDV
jgi:hypothetical protein